MADYNPNQFDRPSARRTTKKEETVTDILNEAARMQERRITGGHIHTGYTTVLPNMIAVGPKVTVSARFESAGPHFTISEFQTAMAKIKAAPNATFVIEPVSFDDGTEGRDAEICVVEWTV